MHPVDEKLGWRPFCRPPSRVPPYLWAEQHLTIDRTSPFPGRFRADTAPWMNEFLDEWMDNGIRVMVMVCSAQSGKTQGIMVGACWSIAEDPGPMMWVLAAHDEAKTFARVRLMPTFQACDPVNRMIPADRSGATQTEIDFPRAPFIINGANSPSKLQSKPVRWLILDEVRNYPPGALQMVRKRTTAFWNSRIIIISTADTTGDEVDEAFRSGDRREYQWPCPHCGHRQPYRWKQMRWDDTDKTRPGGNWDFEAVLNTVRYECEECQKPIHDNQRQRRELANAGRWVKTNPHAPGHVVSFHFNAMLPWWIRWTTLVEEFLRAKVAFDSGSTELLKSFINERLGEPWEEHAQYAANIAPSNYGRGDQWAEEHIRFLTVDVQKDHFWFVVRAWSQAGESRLVNEGRLSVWDDIREEQLRHGVGDRETIIDSGFEATTVYDHCCRWGWTAMKGEDRGEYPHHIEEGIRLLRPFSGILAGDPGIGTSEAGMRVCPLILWSNPTVKDVLHRLRGGKGKRWEVPSDASDDYHAHMRGEAKVETRDTAGRQVWVWRVIGKRPNHMWDCECMQVVAAMMSELLPATLGEPKSETSEHHSK